MHNEQEIDRRHAALSSDKQALLRGRLQGRTWRSGNGGSSGIPKRPPGEYSVLSFAQQRLWFLDQLVPGSSFYTESSAVRIHSWLSVPAFERALNEIVRRHEVLRTTFRLVGDQPMAFVTSERHIPLSVMDLSSLPENEREREVVELATSEARKAFDLSRGPLLNTTLLRLGPADWVFLLAMHHIICDGWSSSVFSRELSQLYSAFLAGNSGPLEELPIQYADFAHWQRNWLRGEVLERQLTYWKEKLTDLPLLDLPADKSRPAAFSYAGSHHKFLLRRPIVEALERLGQSEDATLFMTLLTGFKILLHRYCRQDDIVVGVPSANRSRRELENLIGFFVNVLVMRTDLSGAPTLREVLRRVKTTALDAYAHQDLPFEMLVEALHPQRDLARNPLFQAIFQLHENPIATRRDSNTLPLVEVDRATVKFDLRVDFFKEADGLRGVIEYSSDVFTADRIERFAAHLNIVYEAMVRNPNQGLGDFSLVTAPEKATLAKWGNLPQQTPIDETIVSRFEKQVACTPDAVAVVSDEGTLTYALLDARSSSLAEELRRHHVRPEELVALTSVPSVETVIALIGILKAGCAYLPINSSDPVERLRYMLSDAGVRFLVETATKCGDRLKGLGLEFISIPQCVESTRFLPSDTLPDELAYVMYTSGSTGVPKGVCVSHRAVVRLVTEANFCSMGSAETFLLLAPLTFDATTFETWAPLLNGSRLVIYPEERISLEDLSEILIRYRVSTLWLTAGLFHQIETNRPEMLAGISQLLAGGDVLSPVHVRRHLDRFPHCTLINGYGPTENTTFTCCHAMAPTASVADTVPIGRPITRTQIHVVDRYGHLAPIGVPGELCVAGDGLARGYLKDPKLTAERFVPNPFSLSSRLYRTGDLVQFLPDGNLEFLSRIDSQLKIRGFRVEPGEIEQALLAHGSVENAIVRARVRETGKQLIAYVVPKAEPAAVKEAETAMVGYWQTLYEDLYAAGATQAADPEFDIVGWKSSFTGDPIPAAEMREWLDYAIQRICEDNLGRVLEIGCGTGLLAHRLAALATHYTGTDFSAAVLSRLRATLRGAGFDEPHTKLLVRRADDFTDIERRSFDTIILNSVVQYFPNVDYLFRVLSGAIEAIAPGGRIFLGDIRSLPHLEPFHAWVQSRRPGQTDDTEQLQRVRNAAKLERELLIHPDFFSALQHRFSRISHADVQWKRGRYENELTRYRYDAVLRIDSPKRQPRSARTFDWRMDRLDIRQLARILAESNEEMIVVDHVPNSRVSVRVQFWRRLDASRLGDDHLEGEPPELDDLWEIAEGTPFQAHVRPGQAESECQVRYVRRLPNGSPQIMWEVPTGRERSFVKYANNPAKPLAAALEGVLRAYLQGRLPEYMIPAAFVMVDSLPLTPNGKVDHAALLHLEADRPAVKSRHVAAQSELEKRLVQVWGSVLGVQHLGIDDNFFELGGDSILCIQVVSRAKAAGIHITVKQIFENQTVAKLAVAARPARVPAKQGLVHGASRLTPAQAWLIEQNLPRVDHFNQSILVEVPRDLNLEALDAALRALEENHDALRLRCEPRSGDCHAFFAPLQQGRILQHQIIGGLDPKLRRAELERCCAAVQADLNLARGPVQRVVLYDLGPPEPFRLLLAMHHFVVDGVSWRILFEDLWTAYGQITAGGSPTLPAKTTSMQFWAERLAVYADSPEARSLIDYWLALPGSNPPILPVDGEGPNTVATERVVECGLTVEETQELLTKVPQVCRTQVNDVLLTALARTLALWTGESQSWFDLEGHGREPLFDEVDLSRTVGWFTSIFPVRLQIDADTAIGSSLSSVRSQLETIPGRGISFGVLRYLSTDSEVRRKLKDLPPRQFAFNYLGQFGSASPDSLIRGAAESPGPMRDPNGPRRYLIEVDSSVAGGCMSFRWCYSEATHTRETIERIAGNMIGELRKILEYSRSGNVEVTAADFPSARMEDEDLKRLLTKLQQLNASSP
jgi:amino acid adenylation domain-containing protein/non-ribosomal peptide synthase protein (TIGR01720 family)